MASRLRFGAVGPLLVLVASLTSGCPQADLGPDDYSKCPPEHVSLTALVADYNANAAKVPHLWARAKVRVAIKGWPVWGSDLPGAPSNGYVFLLKGPAGPGPEVGGVNFQLRGREQGLSYDVFRIGAEAARGLYYFWVNMGEHSSVWAGRQKFAGAPGVRGVPIDPMQLAEILCVTELPVAAGGKMPAVVLRLRGRPCAYVVSFLKPQPVTGELKMWREVSFHWDAKKPRRPFRLRLFDADGLCRMIADLDEYAPVEWSGPAGEAPLMPTDIRITCPPIEGVQPASSMRIVLSEMSATKSFPRSVFDFWSPGLPAGAAIHWVDAAHGAVESPGGSG